MYFALLLACSEPVAHIVASETEGAAPLTVALAAENLADGSGVSAAVWDLGDGSSSDAASLEHTWTAPGTYPVSLIITDGRERTASATVEITVTPPTCPEEGEVTVTGALEQGPLTEVSGVVESRISDGVLWVHNDSGDAPQLYAISTEGVLLSTWLLDGAPSGDWEDLAIGLDPDTGGGMLYVGDIGDNGGSRESVTVYRVPEPDAVEGGGTRSASWDAMTLVYPEEPLDAEVLLLDPLTDDLYLVTKDYGGRSGVFRKAAPHIGGEEAVLEQVGELDFGEPPLSGGATTGGDISSDGSRIVIRTYGTIAYLWRRALDGDVASALLGEPCPLLLPGEQQGEAIGFSVDGGALWSISEGAEVPVRHIELVR